MTFDAPCYEASAGTRSNAYDTLGLLTAAAPAPQKAATILAALIGRDPAEARSRAEHLEALNLEFDTWLDER